MDYIENNMNPVGTISRYELKNARKNIIIDKNDDPTKVFGHKSVVQ